MVLYIDEIYKIFYDFSIKLYEMTEGVQMEKEKMRKFDIRDKVGYALGDCANNFTLTMVSSFLLVFATKILGIQAAVVGTLLMVTKFVDAFTDMGMGRIVDTHVDKNGERFRPWILRMAIPTAVSSGLIYNCYISEWSMVAKIVYISVMYLLYGSFCYTAINIPYGAMANAITDEPSERTSLSSFRSIGGIVGNLVVGILVPVIIYVKDDAGNDVVSGPRFLLAGLITSAIAVVCYYLCYRWCLERVKTPNQEQQDAPKMDFVKSIKEVCKDGSILAIVIFGICASSVTGIANTLNQYLFLDYYKDTSLLAIASMSMMIGMLLIVPFTKVLTDKFGKKECSVVGLGAFSAIYVLLFIIRPEEPIVYLLMTLVGYIGLGYEVMVCWAMLGDAIDNHYLITGEKSEGTIYAMYSFLKKLAGAVTGSIGAWSLTLIGYNELESVQTEAVCQSIFDITIIIPGIFVIISFVTVTFMYPLTKKKVEENVQKMRELSAKK